jgi:hypothetical protein
MTKKSILGVLVTLLLLAGVSLGQAIPGVGTRVANGPTLPTNAGQYTMFVLTTGTPTPYICNNNPCMVSGDWVASGGGGGGGGGANTALSNLSGTAINTSLFAASGVTLTLSGFNGTSSLGATGVTIEGGTSYSGGSLAGPGVVIQGGTAGGIGGNGGSVSILGGTALAGVGGSIFLTANNGAGSNQGGGSLFLKSGSPTGTGNYGFLSVGLSGANYVGSYTPLTGFQQGAYFNVGNTQPGEIDFVSGASSNGAIRITGMNFAFSPDNTYDFDLSTYRPRNAWFGGNINAGGSGTFTGALTSGGAITGNSVATNGSGPWSVQGSYGTLSVASAGKTRFGFGPLGPQFSFNGGALTYFANLDSAGVNVVQNANTATKLATAGTPCSGEFSTGVDQYGNALCNVPLTIQLQQYSAGCSTIPGVPGYGIMCFDPTSGLMTDINNGGWTQFVHSNLFNYNADTVEMHDGTAPQTFNIYESWTDSTANFTRMRLGWDSAANSFVVAAEYGSVSGTGEPLCIYMGSYGAGAGCRWNFSAGSASVFYPAGNSTQDVGKTANQVRDFYLGRSLYLGGSAGTSGQCPISAGPGVAPAWGSCSTGFSYPTAGAVLSTGSAFTSVAETNNYVLVGVSGAWTAAAITGAMLPNPSASTLGGVESITSASHNWVAYIDTSGVPHQSQPGFADISGTISAGQLPNPSASTLGGVESITSASHNWVSYIDTSGVPHQSQPTLADVAAGVAPSGTFDFTGATPKVPTGTANSNNTNAASEAYVDTNYMGNWLQIGPPSSVGSNITAGGSNATHGNMFEFNIPSAITTGHIEVDVTTADNSANTYDFCIYSGAASSTVNLLAHTGAIAGSSINGGATGYTNLAWTSTATLAPGRYYLFLFGNEATPTLTIGGTTFTSFYHNSSQAITPTAGACSATLSSSADSPGQPTFPWFTLN